MLSRTNDSITVIGAGLAGCEAAWAAAQLGVRVRLCEMKPQRYSPAHSYPGFAELVCSNSLKATRMSSAAGLLKAEMRLYGSLVLQCADSVAVSAGGALAVDRERFSDLITQKIKEHPLIEVAIGEVTELPQGRVIIATGPLTSPALTEAIAALCGAHALSFYDASAPIVTHASIDTERTFLASRYGRGEADYINCPFTQGEYDSFYDALVSAQSVELQEFEKQYFKVYEGCMPIEVMARRGRDTIRYGPMRPVGITDPRTGKRPWANLQLRCENAGGSMYNLVGFQTNLTFGEQKRVFSMIPGLENAEFARYGVMHRNTFIDSPRLLNATFGLRENANITFAGQITGVEGYTESAASGIIAGISAASGNTMPPPPQTMLGALCGYISDPTVENFQPMGSNMGILPPLSEIVKGKEARYLALAERALAAAQQYAKAIF